MIKERLYDAMEASEKSVVRFSDIFKDENEAEYDYQNWSSKDVINHIAAWVRYSADNWIFAKQNGKPKEHDDAENFVFAFNLINYEKTKEYDKAKSLENIKEAFSFFGKTMSLYSEEELMLHLSSDFDLPLYKCALIDLSIHPRLHLMYEYIKSGMYENFAAEIFESEKDFIFYNEGNDLGVYSFKDFFENDDKRKKIFSEMKKNYDCDKELINKITEINI